jgi:hypothetical protein
MGHGSCLRVRALPLLKGSILQLTPLINPLIRLLQWALLGNLILRLLGTLHQPTSFITRAKPGCLKSGMTSSRQERI